MTPPPEPRGLREGGFRSPPSPTPLPPQTTKGFAPGPQIKLHLFDHLDLEDCGLSGRKREYLIGLGRHFAEQPRLELSLHTMTDEAVIAALTEVRGVGRWTAEMVLIFALLRPDVLPLADLGLMKAMALHYRNGRDISGPEAERLAAVWMPWRSVATWYLWRSLDPEPVDY